MCGHYVCFFATEPENFGLFYITKLVINVHLNDLRKKACKLVHNRAVKCSCQLKELI